MESNESREPVSRANKREAVLGVLAERGHLSDRTIAKICRVSQPFVSKLRRSLTAAAAPEEVSVSGTDDDADVHPDLVNPPEDEAGIDPDLADAADDPELDASRAAHARLVAESVRGSTLLPDVEAARDDVAPRDGSGDAQPSAPHTVVSAVAETGAGATRIINDDVPVFQEEESEPPPITVVVKAPPRGEPDTRTLQQDVYQDKFRALQMRLEREQLLHGRLVERVARGEKTEADLAQSRAQIRRTKDEIEDYGTLLKHEQNLARARVERLRVERYYDTVDRTEADFTAIVETTRDMDRLIVELGAARERVHTLVNSENGLVALRGHAARMPDPRRALLESLVGWTSQADGIELHLLARLRGLRVLRDKSAPPPTDADRLDVWAETWTRRAIEVARAQGPALPEPDPDSDDSAAA
jgi:hypothetical protein